MKSKSTTLLPFSEFVNQLYSSKKRFLKHKVDAEDLSIILKTQAKLKKNLQTLDTQFGFFQSELKALERSLQLDQNLVNPHAEIPQSPEEQEYLKNILIKQADKTTDYDGKIQDLQKTLTALDLDDKTITTDATVFFNCIKDLQSLANAPNHTSPDAIHNLLQNTQETIQLLGKIQTKISSQKGAVEDATLTSNAKNRNLTTEQTHNRNDLQKASDRVNRLVDEINIILNKLLLNQKRFLTMIDTVTPKHSQNSIKHAFLESIDNLRHFMTHSFSLESEDEALLKGFLNVCQTLQGLPKLLKDTLLSESEIINDDLRKDVIALLEGDNAVRLQEALLHAPVDSNLVSLQSFNPYSYSNYANPQIVRWGDRLGQYFNDDLHRSSAIGFGSTYVSILLKKIQRTPEELSLIRELEAIQAIDLTKYSDLKKVFDLSNNDPITPLEALKNASFTYIKKLEDSTQALNDEVALIESTLGAKLDPKAATNEEDKAKKWHYIEQMDGILNVLRNELSALEAEKKLCQQYLKTLEEDIPTVDTERTHIPSTVPINTGLFSQLKKINFAPHKDQYCQRFSKYKTGDELGIYVVSSTSRVNLDELTALKILANDNEPSLMISNVDEPILSKKDNIDNFRIVQENASQEHQIDVEIIKIYSEAIPTHQSFLNTIKTTPLDTNQPPPDLPAPKTPPVQICIHPENTAGFKHIHSTLTNYPTETQYGSNLSQDKTQREQYKKTRVHTAFQLATNDLEKRIGTRHDNVEIIKFLKQLKLIIHTKDINTAHDLSTAYLIILEHKYGLSQKEALKTLKVNGLQDKMFNPANVYSWLGTTLTSDCKKYFNDKEIRAAYKITQPLTKVNNAALKSLFLRDKEIDDAHQPPPPPPA